MNRSTEKESSYQQLEWDWMMKFRLDGLTDVRIDNENRIYKIPRENFDRIQFCISDVEFDNVILPNHEQIDNVRNTNNIHKQNNSDTVLFYIYLQRNNILIVSRIVVFLHLLFSKSFNDCLSLSVLLRIDRIAGTMSSQCVDDCPSPIASAKLVPGSKYSVVIIE